MRRLAAIVAGVVCVAGCGGDGGGAAESANRVDRACPEGTELVRARDVIGPTPRGFEVVRGDRKAIDSFVGQLRRQMGAIWRGYDARVLVRSDAQNGAAVIVVNAHERRVDEVVAGAKDAPAGQDLRRGPIEIAGEEGWMQQAVDGAFIAMAPAGDCALLLLVSDTEARLRDAAAQLPSRR
jgi:hypothetical protein